MKWEWCGSDVKGFFMTFMFFPMNAQHYFKWGIDPTSTLLSTKTIPLNPSPPHKPQSYVTIKATRKLYNPTTQRQPPNSHFMHADDKWITTITMICVVLRPGVLTRQAYKVSQQFFLLSRSSHAYITALCIFFLFLFWSFIEVLCSRNSCVLSMKHLTVASRCARKRNREKSEVNLRETFWMEINLW